MSTPLETWRRSQHTFLGLPENVRGLIRSQHLSVPTGVATLMPDKELSILDLVATNFPGVWDATPPPGYQFFTAEKPDIDALLTTQIPPASIVHQLYSQASQQWLDGADSVHLPGTVQHLPIWAPKMWADLHTIVYPKIGIWKKALAWLDRKELRQNFREEVNKTLEQLSMLSWDGNLSTSFTPPHFLKDELVFYLSRRWLNDGHIDQLHSFLETEINLCLPKFAAETIHIFSTVLTRYLFIAFAQKDTYEPTGSSFLAKFGQRLSSKSRHIAGIFHVHTNHWISICIDLETKTLSYGDPALDASDPFSDDRSQWDMKLVAALQWWINQHLPEIASNDLDLDILLTPRQNFAVDTWSCGIFSFNALEHELLPGRPLLQHTDQPIFNDVARLQLLCRLIKCHHQVLPDDVALASKVFQPIHPLLSAEDTLTTSTSLPLTASKTSSSSKKRPNPKDSKQVSDVLSVGLQRLSVSPQKPPPVKKRKIDSLKSDAVITPIFQRKPLGPAAKEYLEKAADKVIFRALGKNTNEFFGTNSSEEAVLPVKPKSEPQDPPLKASSEPPQLTGRPRIEVLDELTIALEEWTDGGVRKFKCAGTGCAIKWAPRSKARILGHCKTCFKLTRELRELASKHSRATAPSALVDAQSMQPSTPTSTISSSPASTVATPTPMPVIRQGKIAFNFGKAATRQLHEQLDLAVVKLVAIARIPPAVVDSEEWKEVFRLQTPSYHPAGRNKLVETHIMSEQARVSELQIIEIKESDGGTVSWDGGALRSGESFYSIHFTTQDGRVYLLELRECADVRHTGAFLAEMIFEALEPIGLHLIDAVAADSTGNTSVSREIICARLPTVLNLPDPAHHLNNTWKEIARLEVFDTTVKQVRGVIKFFRHSNHAKGLLKKKRAELGLGAGLESIGKTRFSTLTWSAISLARNLDAIQALCTSGEITIPDYNDLFLEENSMERLAFQMSLTQFIAVGEGIARAIECLEATSTNPADVYLYWLAVVSHMKQALLTSKLPNNVCGQIRQIIITRWQQFFVNGPTNVHKTAFYLNPSYVHSSIFRNTNPLSFNITLPAKSPSVPPGIKNPGTFKEIGEYLFSLVVTEVKHGRNEYLKTFKNRPVSLSEQYKAQFTAYAQGSYPFTTPLGDGQSPLEWWRGFEGTANGGILAAIAIKLYSVVPHSMADERTMSVVTMINSAQRNRQSVKSVFALAQIRSYYLRQKKPKARTQIDRMPLNILNQSCLHQIRKTTHRLPILKFFDVKHLVRSIDEEDERPDKENPNYDESDDEGSVDARDSPGAVRGVQPASLETAEKLPLEDDDGEIDLASSELEEILAATRPKQKGAKGSKTSSQIETGPDEMDAEEGDFELGGWM
ncbi:hypothetical protein D9619_003512 [Psilocybe cf. subviscida]|uniref:Ubiquitin-like protease family profile domain-containing protein n=1 Tax=Psilocybe cf. subviscida TaxID=2480587 RepID=A0A8H5AWN6_9AGAR|nr:hypothetical protein D9619_003523 [Psilocybe cf. subviscida]KAF5312856.1 hypothetical protein D9619_003512 [Psilocybe cf. subviscida]